MQNREIEIDNNLFDLIPLDAIKEIFSLVDIKDIHRLPLVCKNFNTIINENYMNYNYNNKNFFIKWLTNETKDATDALQKFIRQQLKVSPFNRPDLSLFKKIFYYYSFIFVFMEICLLFNECMLTQSEQKSNDYYKQLIKEKNQAVMQFRLSPDAGNTINQFIIADLEKNIEYYQTQLISQSPFLSDSSFDIFNTMRFWLIIIYFILTQYQMFISANRFENSFIQNNTLKELKTIIKEYCAVPGNLLTAANIQPGQTTHRELKNILKNTIFNLDKLSKDTSDFLRQAKFSGRIINETDLTPLTPVQIKYTKGAFNFFAFKFPDKKIYSESDKLQLKS